MMKLHLKYCVQPWLLHLNKVELEKVQIRATKMLKGLKQLPDEERLQHLGLFFSLESRQVRGDMTEVGKIMHDGQGKTNVVLY